MGHSSWQRFVGLHPSVCTMGTGPEYMRKLVVSLDIHDFDFEHPPTLREAQVVSVCHMVSAHRGILGPTNRRDLLGCGI